ncbi:MAG: stage II sporulation protein M, partial [Gammaproteobacteria bacterium]|nr:stage II sporulation protein M [Gammaproteobacteria bacterium]
MKQQDFESKYNILWDALEQAFETSKIHDLADFPQNYRQICHHLAIAKHRRYSTYLIDRLNQLALKCHYHLYRHNPRFNHQWLKFIAFEFPHTLRENARYIWTSIALFLIPGLLMFLLCLLNGEMIYSIMPAEHIRELENMYDPAARVLGRARESETDLMMFGYYIKNNIGISFQTFAGGMLFGLGSVFFMFYNGLVIGATAGHITNLNYIDTFYPFVVGHGAFELIAIIFSGAAGLRIGFSLIAPGPCSRINALQISSRSAIKIIYGSTIMLLIAAFLEAFWSSNTDIPIIIKYSVG